MQDALRSYAQKGVAYAGRHKRALVILTIVVALTPLLIIAAAYAIINPCDRYMLSEDDDRHITVGIVLGAGITSEGKPFKELQGRLDSAAAALDKGMVDKLILSGDNRFEDYDEPNAMREYLITQKGIDAVKLQPDYAGRSTYESCERAAKIFEVKRMIIFSAGSHLPRAIYLCRHFGIESYGVASHVEANNAYRREMVARVKAVYNATLRGEPTVLGTPIPL